MPFTLKSLFMKVVPNKEHLSNAKRFNNPVELESLQIKLAIEVHAIVKTREIGSKCFKIVRNGFFSARRKVKELKRFI